MRKHKYFRALLEDCKVRYASFQFTEMQEIKMKLYSVAISRECCYPVYIHIDCMTNRDH